MKRELYQSKIFFRKKRLNLESYQNICPTIYCVPGGRFPQGLSQLIFSTRAVPVEVTTLHSIDCLLFASTDFEIEPKFKLNVWHVNC